MRALNAILFAWLLAISPALADVPGATLVYTYGGSTHTYNAGQDGGSVAGAFVSSQNAALAAQIDGSIRQAALGRMPPLPSISTGPVAQPFAREQFRWLQTVNARLADPQTQRLAQQYAHAPLEAMVRHDAFTLAESLDGYFQNVDALSHADPRASRKLMEAGRGVFVDEQGVINLPKTKRQVELLSSWSSPTGREVRGDVNRLMVAKEILENDYQHRCEQSATECSKLSAQMDKFRDQYDDAMLALQLADRLGVLGPFSLQDPLTHLREMSQLYFGLAKGVFLGLADIASGAIDFVSSPKKAIHGLVEAIRHHEQTWAAIKSIVHDQYEQLLHGTPEEQGVILGKTATQVVTTVLPLAGAAGGALKTMRAISLVEGATVAERIGNVVQLGKLSIVGAVTDRLARSAAIFEKADEMVQLGQLSRVSAEAAKVVGTVLPRTADVLLRSREAIAALPTIARGLGGASEAARAASALEDGNIASLIHTQPKLATEFLQGHGPDALAGVSDLVQQTKMPSLIEDWSRAGLGEQLATFGRQVTQTAGGLGVGSDTLSLRNLATAARTVAQNTPLTARAFTYLVRHALNGQSVAGRAYSVEELAETALQYGRLEKAFGDLPPKSLGQVEVWRGLAAKPGLTEEAVFEYHPKYNYPSNHRFTQPGEGGLYTTQAEESLAKATIFEELRQPSSVIYAKGQFSLNKVLDLTDESVIRRLGITPAQLVDETNYGLTHQIGNLAKQFGFDAIRAYSAKNPAVINIVILK